MPKVGRLPPAHTSCFLLLTSTTRTLRGRVLFMTFTIPSSRWSPQTALLRRHAKGGSRIAQLARLVFDVQHGDFAMACTEARPFARHAQRGCLPHSSHVLSLTFSMATSRWPAQKRARLPDTPKEVACRTARMSTAWQKQRGLKALPEHIAWAQTDCH